MAQPVVLLHGLWLKGVATAFWRLQLNRAGYRAYSFSYPSVRASLAENAERLRRYIQRNVGDTAVHLVGHSLGGLVILRLLADHPKLAVGRVVLVGTPFAGSRAAERLLGFAAGRLLVGRSMRELAEHGTPAPPAQVEVGVIAGSNPLGAGRLVTRLPRPHDGTVAVVETRLPGVHEHLVLPASHSELLISTRTARQICVFLTTGHFDRAAA